MADFELTRTQGDRRLYALEGVGTLRLHGLFSRAATAEAAGTNGERELAILDGKGWGRRPVKVTLDDPDAVDPGLLLFAAFIVRGLAEDAGAAAGGASAGATGTS